MAIVFSPNIIEIAVVARLAARPHVNVWHMWFDSELGSDTKEAVARDFANNWQDHMLGNLSTEYVLDSFEWRSLDEGDGTVGQLAPDPAKPVAGALGSTTIPPNVAYLIHKTTDARPRGRRDGRCYLGGVVEAACDNSGNVSSVYVNDIQAQLDLFYDGVSDTSGTAAGDRYPAVLETTAASRSAGTTQVTIGSRRVTAITIDTRVATQRERLR